jgi:hypothetical protein
MPVIERIVRNGILNTCDEEDHTKDNMITVEMRTCFYPNLMQIENQQEVLFHSSILAFIFQA